MKKGTLKSAKKSTINRTNIKNDILRVIKESGKPISTQEISELLKRSWHTIIRYCLDLENEEKLAKFEVGRIYVWQIRMDQKT